MLTMEPKVTRHFVQTTPRLKRLYRAWVGAMKGTKVCLERDAVTQDALGNALWMWAREQDSEELAVKLAPYLDEFEKVWAEKDQDPSDLDHQGSVSETKVLSDVKRKRKQG